MNRPWMPLYIADYLADTAHLNAAQSGAYLHFIMHYWQTGGLPDEDQALSRIARMTIGEWRKARPIIAPFFQERWQHKRIDAELARASDISSKRRASAEQRHSKSNAIAQQLDTHAGATSPSQSQPHQETSSLRSEVRARPISAEFEQFWQVFPNKIGKRDAAKAFDRIAKTGAVEFQRLMAGLAAYVNKTDDRPWCNPATWLNQGRWDDQPAPEVLRNDRQNANSILAAADRQIERFGGMEAARAYVPGSSGPEPLSLDFGTSPPRVRLIPKG